MDEFPECPKCRFPLTAERYCIECNEFWGKEKVAEYYNDEFERLKRKGDKEK